MSATNKPAVAGEASIADRLAPPLLSLRMFSDDQLEEIHRASLLILEQTGVGVQDEEARAVLADAGCSVSEQAQLEQRTPEKPILQTESQEQEVRLSFADAYPENWEHQLSQRARFSR